MRTILCSKCKGLSNRDLHFQAYICEKCGHRDPLYVGPPMNNEQAVRLGESLFGSTSRVTWNASRLTCHKTPLPPYQVGNDKGVYGVGYTWEEAFENSGLWHR